MEIKTTVTRSGDNFKAVMSFQNGKVAGNSYESNLTGILNTAKYHQEVLDSTSAALSFLRDMLTLQAKVGSDTFDEYQEKGLAGICEALSDRIEYHNSTHLNERVIIEGWEG